MGSAGYGERFALAYRPGSYRRIFAASRNNSPCMTLCKANCVQGLIGLAERGFCRAGGHWWGLSGARFPSKQNTLMTSQKALQKACH
jgi:hypothetical protein